MLLFILLSAMPTILLLYLLWQYGGTMVFIYKRNKVIRKIPTQWPVHWLLGNLLQIDTSEAVFSNWFQTHIVEHEQDMTVAWYSAFMPIIYISHPRLLKDLLKEPKALGAYRLLLPWLGEGLLIANGEKWLRNRRLLTPAFHVQLLKQYLTIFNTSAQDLISKWSSLSPSASTTDVLEEFSLLALDVMLQTAFSYKSHCQTEPKQSRFIASVMEASDLAVGRMLHLHHQVDLLFNLTPSGFRFRRAVGYIHQRTEEIIQERRESLLKEEEKKRLKENRKLDLLDILLTAKDDDGTGMPDEQIRNEVNTFLFEGHDTTASGLAWSLYCLAKYPEHQDKCRQEVLKVFGERTELEWNDLKSLEYTTMCIKEAMRLYTPVYNVYRDTTEKLVLDGKVIPKGSWIALDIFSIHRNPRVWDNPEEYNPLRFTLANSEDRDPFAYIPFSAGSRNCIGQQFAINEEKAVIATLLSRFSFSRDLERIPRCKRSVVLKAEDGIWLTVKPL